jgi:hypothetical protein
VGGPSSGGLRLGVPCTSGRRGLLSSGGVTETVLPWDLVGIDPRLIDPGLVVGDGGS